MIVFEAFRERGARESYLAMPRNGDLLNAYAADNLCAVCLARLVVENEQALAG